MTCPNILDYFFVITRSTIFLSQENGKKKQQDDRKSVAGWHSDSFEDSQDVLPLLSFFGDCF